MQVTPTRAAFLELSRQGNVIPVCTDLLADLETPVSAFAKLRGTGPAFLLESVEGGENVSRFSFIGCNPRQIITARPGDADPLKLLESELAGYKPVEIPGLPPFTGGAVGYLGYEFIHSVEPSVPLAARDELGVPAMWFMFCDSVVAFDRAHQTMRLIVNAHVGADSGAAYDAACTELLRLQAALGRPSPLAPATLGMTGPVQVPPGNFTQAAFEKMVDDSKEFIRAGDIFQIVLSQRFSRAFTKTPLDLYRALRTVNPSPYMFLLDTGDFALVGASPEVHVRLTGRKVEIRPIAGTRPRGKSTAEDVALEKELLADEKEKAEHLMLVDLARNDIGRVCAYGTVKVPEFMTIERYSHVMHIVSQVEGQLAPERSAFDLMRATFPAGTVSGAPKIRAMQLIAEKEGTQRGSYAGALGYFSYDGNLDSCITLRTALVKDGQVHIQAGAGVVADSVPAAEYQETINKASALFKAIALADRLSS
ncbi:Anthranilate synthase component 1 [Lacunisphaera limnophila]|uniref:Anthranilate synthase component 1 n=1 Tax=Lacunisphaera limnophila TaxID=1838286 RepID=A0A1D8AXF3_9BACT|nr:anthranilate synthase component I [Lacunisphaera limnophila]AOS45575.1 Anthranilate synthase component 1 [Lacunisphaera limnophila]